MPTEKGKKLLEVIRFVRSTMEQVALLLQTCDEQFKKAGWRSLHQNTAVTESGASIYCPKDWLPKEAFRIYGRDGSKTVAYVAVILDDANQSYRGLHEPLVTAGCFIPPERDIDTQHQYYWVRSHCLQTENVDGTEAAVDLTKVAPETRTEWGKEHVSRQVTFGLPLANCTGSTELKEQVIDKVLAMVEKHEGEVFTTPAK